MRKVGRLDVAIGKLEPHLAETRADLHGLSIFDDRFLELLLRRVLIARSHQRDASRFGIAATGGEKRDDGGAGKNTENDSARDHPCRHDSKLRCKSCNGASSKARTVPDESPETAVSS